MASCARDVPITLWLLANDPGVVWGFDSDAQGTPANLAGSVFDLVVAWPNYQAPLGTLTAAGRIDHSSGAVASDQSSGDAILVVDLVTANVKWPVTILETETIPRSPGKVTYDLFRTITDDSGVARRSLWCGGSVTVKSHLPLNLAEMVA